MDDILKLAKDFEAFAQSARKLSTKSWNADDGGPLSEYGQSEQVEKWIKHISNTLYWLEIETEEGEGRKPESEEIKEKLDPYFTEENIPEEWRFWIYSAAVSYKNWLEREMVGQS